MVIYFNLGMF